MELLGVINVLPAGAEEGYTVLSRLLLPPTHVSIVSIVNGNIQVESITQGNVKIRAVQYEENMP